MLLQLGVVLGLWMGFLKNGMVPSFSKLLLLSGPYHSQLAFRCRFVGWFLSDWHCQPCCSRITVSGSPPVGIPRFSQHWASVKGVEQNCSSWLFVLVALSPTDVRALSTQFTLLCAFFLPQLILGACSNAGESASTDTILFFQSSNSPPDSWRRGKSFTTNFVERTKIFHHLLSCPEQELQYGSTRVLAVKCKQ